MFTESESEKVGNMRQPLPCGNGRKNTWCFCALWIVNECEVLQTPVHLLFYSTASPRVDLTGGRIHGQSNLEQYRSR